MYDGGHDGLIFRIALRFSLASLLGPILVLGLIALPCTVLAQPDDPGELTLSSLRTWIKANWYDGLFTDLGYNQARIQMYGYVDEDGGQIECIYTGFQQASGFVTYPNPINAEHLVPQSFYGSATPMKSDIWSIRPCHGSANSARSNDSYGEVADGSAQWYGVSSSGDYLSTGTTPSDPDAFSEGSGSLWEPREEVKGDVARSVFYFYTMYPTQAGVLSDVGDPAILYQWHLDDPVDATELTRNQRVEVAQGNRNPYIDHPDWVYDAWFWEPPATVPGCMSASACNFNPAANEDDASCVFLGDPCDDGDALTFDDVYTDCSAEGYGCEGEPVVLPGCTSGSACNYDPSANQNDGSCLFEGDPCDDGDATTFNDNYTDCSAPGFGCAGTPSEPECTADLDGDGLVAVSDVLALLGEFGCLAGCSADITGDGQVTTADMLVILAEFGTICP